MRDRHPYPFHDTQTPAQETPTKGGWVTPGKGHAPKRKPGILARILGAR